MTNFNVWQPQGTVIPAVSGDAPEQANVMYEGTPHILSANPDGKIFKMWFTSGPLQSPIGMAYAESNDGLAWTRYSGNPITPPTWGIRVFKHAGTYYAYTSDGVTATAIRAWTSPDGLVWTQRNSTAITSGDSGFDAVAVGQMNIADVVGGIFYGYFYGLDTLGNYHQGMATSVDGINWTKSPSNPVASLLGGTYRSGVAWNTAASLGFAKVNGVYHAWGQIASQTLPESGLAQPSDLMHWTSSSVTGPWTPDVNIALQRTRPEEGPSFGGGQVADPSIVEVNGSTYIYYTADGNAGAGNNYVINCSIAPMTIAQLVQTHQGIQNFPLSGAEDLNLRILASDSFARADGGLGSNWSNVTSGGIIAGRIVSHQAQSSVAGSDTDSFYSGQSWANDQWTEITVGNIARTGSLSYIGLCIRASNTGGYRLYWNGTSGSPGTWTISKNVNGTFTNLAQGSADWIVNNGDKLTAVAIGSNIMFFYNGVMFAVETDSSIASGSPGFLSDGITATGDATISAWAGGDFVNAPPIMANVYSVTDSRNYGNFPNSSRNVQGTLTYDVPSVFSLRYWFDTSFNRTQPLPVDSRVAGTSVDSRVAPNIPENSRATQ